MVCSIQHATKVFGSYSLNIVRALTLHFRMFRNVEITVDFGRVWLDFVQTNVRIQWNPVCKAFHRIRLCGNERSGS